MNPFPLLALAMVVTGYTAATHSLQDDIAAPPKTEIAAWDASAPLSIYDMPGHAMPDFARPHCEPHSTLAANLQHDFEEHPVVALQTSGGLDIQLFASDLMGTWTLVHKGSDGISCIVSSGTGWAKGTSPETIFAAAALAS